MSARLILFVPPLVAIAAPWRRVNEAGEVLERGQLMPGEVLASGEPVTAIVPGVQVAVRWLDLPRGRPAQVVAAARWQLAASLGHHLNEMHVVTGAAGASGLLPVAAVSRNLFESWHAWLNEIGAPAARIVPDNLCFTAPEGQLAVASLPEGDVIIVGKGLSVTVQPELVQAVLAGRSCVNIETGEVLDQLASGSLFSPFDLSTQAPQDRGRGTWRLVMGLAAAVVVSPLILIWSETLRDHGQAIAALSRAKEQAVAYQPHLAQAEDPLAQVEKLLADAPPPGGQVQALARLAKAVEAVPGTRLDELDASGSLIRGIVTFPDINGKNFFEDSLSRQGLRVTSCDPGQEDGQTFCAFNVEVMP